MAEIIFRLPSKVTQYGYVEVREDGYDEGDVTPEALAERYVDWINRFQKAEMASRPKKVDSRLAEKVFEEIADKVIRTDGPTNITSGGLDSADGDGHSFTEEKIKDMVRTELGGSIVSETPAPWDGKGEVPANLKPWQKGARKAPVASLFD